MYTPIGIQQLSDKQISRLLNGHGVRVKHGSHHKVHLSSEQHKKLIRAHHKGAGVTLVLDPYQIEHHQCMRGEGVMSSLKKAYGHAKTVAGHARRAIGHATNFYQEHKETLEPYAQMAKKAASHKATVLHARAAPHLQRHLGEEFGSHLASHAHQAALHAIDQAGEVRPEYPMVMGEEEMTAIEQAGEGLRRHRGRPRRGGALNLKKIGQTIKSGVSKLGNMAVSKAKDYANSPQGKAMISQAANAAVMAAMSGAGVRKHKRVVRGRGCGGALYAAGYNGP
jgi:hypothetical protein